MKKYFKTIYVLGLFCILSTGKLYAEINADLTASRTECASPCTVVFSAINTIDTATPDEHDRFKELGYRFRFDDPTSGVHKTTGLPQNSQTGGPLTTHTFICNTDSYKYANGECTFNVVVRAENTLGDYDDAHVAVTVSAPEHAFAGTDTICISPSGQYDGDIACPANAQKLAALPNIGAYTGKRILLRRGEVFDGDLCIGYGEKNVLVEPFGNKMDAKPELLNGINIGVDTSCSDLTVTNIDADSYGARWAENITITGLRTPNVSMGMSYHQVGLHDLDMDYYNAPSGGFIEMSKIGKYCTTNAQLDCAKVPYPNGLYMSELTVVGSDQASVAGNNGGGGLAIGAYNCPMINWIGMVGTTFWNSNQHQFRLEGGQRLAFSHNNMRGHTRGSSKKHTMTVRSCGYSDIDIGAAITAGTGRHNVNANQPGAPWTRWVVLADNIHGSTDAMKSSFKLQIAPTNGNAEETIVDAIVERATFVTGIESSIDMALNGYYLTARTDNTYTPERQDCKIVGPGGNPLAGEIQCAGVVPPEPSQPARVDGCF